MQTPFRDRDDRHGGVKGYPPEQMFEEVAFIAYYFHWDYKTLMEMDHFERRKWCELISEINKKSGEAGKEKSILDL